jgi:ATP-binding cassette, subfamily B, bacterial HlyB/CyaB
MEAGLHTQIINDFFASLLSEADLRSCAKFAQIINPKAGQLIAIQAGIYLTLKGKVRLLDESDELIVTLKPRDSFGEFTLFSQFNPYQARASLNLQLAFIPGAVLLPLLEKYPQLRDNFWQQASKLDALIGENNEKNGTLKTVVDKERLDGKSQITERGKEKDNAALNLTLNGKNAASDSSLRVTTKSERKLYKALIPSPTQRVGHWLQQTTRRYPFFAQQSSADCGVACLIMIGRYWGKQLNINQLRDRCNVDRNGTSLRSLSTAAESIGLSTRPVKANINQLARQTLPAIAHWEGKHYVVVYAIAQIRDYRRSSYWTANPHNCPISSRMDGIHLVVTADSFL